MVLTPLLKDDSGVCRRDIWQQEYVGATSTATRPNTGAIAEGSAIISPDA